MFRTPLFEEHVGLGGHLVEFGGWEMPVFYSSIIAEHLATRNACGLFDICHMGEIFVQGRQAFDLVQLAVSRDISGTRVGKMALSVMCNEQGGIIDDLTVYRLGEEKFMLVVNAGTRQKDFEWIKALQVQKNFDALVEDKTMSFAKFDLQGPIAQKVLQGLASFDLSALKFYNFVEQKKGLVGFDCIVSRSGYTGEDGFEIYFDRTKAVFVWRKILQAGKSFGIVPVGLGARDTLRLEAGFNLYGNEMDETVSPFECRYGWVVSESKDFVGKKSIFEKKQSLQRVLVGFEMTENAVARHGYKVFSGDKEIGVVTSGVPSPFLKKNIGFCSIEKEFAFPESKILVQVREKKFLAKIVPLPFYKRQKLQ